MSVDATRWAWSVEVENSSQRLVLLSLADRAGENHTCYPSLERLAEDTALNIKTVQKVVAELIESGLVEDTGEKRGVSGRVRVLKLIHVEDRHTQKRDNPKSGNIPKNGMTNHPKNGMTDVPNFGMQNLKGNLKEEPNNNIYTPKAEKPKSKPKQKPKFSFEQALLDLNADSQLVLDFIEIRKTKGAVDSQTAFNGFITQQQKSGLSLNQVLEMCAINSWKGFNASWVLPTNNHPSNSSAKPNRMAELEALRDQGETYEHHAF